MGEPRSINAEPNPGRKQSQARQPPPRILSGMRLITLYVPEPYLHFLDELVLADRYPNRSEAIRFAIRDLILEEAF